MGITFGDLFAGIGGFSLGFSRAGMVCKWQVEIDNKCRRSLEINWPVADQLDDIRDWKCYVQVDVMCGGFPCQDLSSANTANNQGLSGSRSGLWKEFKRWIEDGKPTWVVVENTGSRWRDWVPSVRGDLWRIGYASVPIQLCASQFGAYHRRPRCFVVANANRESEPLSAIYEEVARLRTPTGFGRERFESPTGIISETDGLSTWMARAYGNAVCPDVAEWIGQQLIKQPTA